MPPSPTDIHNKLHYSTREMETTMRPGVNSLRLLTRLHDKREALAMLNELLNRKDKNVPRALPDHALGGTQVTHAAIWQAPATLVPSRSSQGMYSRRLATRPSMGEGMYFRLQLGVQDTVDG